MVEDLDVGDSVTNVMEGLWGNDYITHIGEEKLRSNIALLSVIGHAFYNDREELSDLSKGIRDSVTENYLSLLHTPPMEWLPEELSCINTSDFQPNLLEMKILIAKILYYSFPHIPGIMENLVIVFQGVFGLTEEQLIDVTGYDTKVFSDGIDIGPAQGILQNMLEYIGKMMQQE